VRESSRMPIVGTIMIENPVQSSYPPSRVYKLIQKDYGSEKAEQYLRRAREALFAFNQNIAENSVMTNIVNQLGLDRERIITGQKASLAKIYKLRSYASRKTWSPKFPDVYKGK